MQKTKATILTLTLITIILICGILASGCKKETPKDTIKDFAEAMKTKDWSKAWDLISTSSKKDFALNFYDPIMAQLSYMPPENQKKVVPKLGVSFEKISKMSKKEFYILIMSHSEANEQLMKKYDPEKLAVESELIKGDKATLKIKDTNDTIYLVREEDKWKLELK